MKYGKNIAGIVFALFLALSVNMFSLHSNAAGGSHQTGDVILFGSYPQARVNDKQLIETLDAQPLQSDGTVVYRDGRYLKAQFPEYSAFLSTDIPNEASSCQDDNGYFADTVYWFKYEPVRWLVLENKDNSLLLLAEMILDAKAYQDSFKDTTWAESSIRAWLNEQFFSAALNQEERQRIISMDIANNDNPSYQTDAGADTKDKLFLLSYGEIAETEWGFEKDVYEYDTARGAQGTDFAKYHGLFVAADNAYPGNSHWWLRSPGSGQTEAANVNPDGIAGALDYARVDVSCVGVRPALYLAAESPSSVQHPGIADTGSSPDKTTLILLAVPVLAACAVSVLYLVFGKRRVLPRIGNG